MSFTTKIVRNIDRNGNLNSATFFARGISTSFVRHIDLKWRIQKGLTKNPNAFGPLTNLPDYTFQDGRPTPYGSRQLARINIQQNLKHLIVDKVKQLDYAIEKHAMLQGEKMKKKQAILDSKLKPKGTLLLTKNDKKQ